jgi:hypothetical protein
MKMTYWIAERKDGNRMMTLRFETREEFEEYIKDGDLRSYVQRFFDLPREITVEADSVLEIILPCINRNDFDYLPWEKK